MSKEIKKEVTATEKEAARKQLTEAIFGEATNNSNTEKENKDMTRTNENLKKAAFINIFNAALTLMAADKTSDTDFHTDVMKAEAAAKKVCETYKLDEDIEASKKFAQFCDFYISRMSTEEIAAVAQDETKLNEVFDNAGKATVKSLD